MSLTLGETTDIYLLDDFTPEMDECSGYLALACRLIRRLKTPRGFLPFWPNFGNDLKRYSLSKIPSWQIARDVIDELGKDEQVKEVIATPIYADQGRTIHLDVFVRAEVGTFTFSMTATDAAAMLISLQKAA
jgi:hypothetical protein